MLHLPRGLGGEQFTWTRWEGHCRFSLDEDEQSQQAKTASLGRVQAVPPLVASALGAAASSTAVSHSQLSSLSRSRLAGLTRNSVCACPAATCSVAAAALAAHFVSANSSPDNHKLIGSCRDELVPGRVKRPAVRDRSAPCVCLPPPAQGPCPAALTTSCRLGRSPAPHWLRGPCRWFARSQLLMQQRAWQQESAMRSMTIQHLSLIC